MECVFGADAALFSILWKSEFSHEAAHIFLVHVTKATLAYHIRPRPTLSFDKWSLSIES